MNAAPPRLFRRQASRHGFTTHPSRRIISAASIVGRNAACSTDSLRDGSPPPAPGSTSSSAAPGRVGKLAGLDLVPTHKIFAATNQAIATDYYHWFFLIQPHDLPERLIGA